MQNEDKYKFIDEELKGLWPDWKPTEAETRVWLGILSNYDYDIARKAIQQYFTDKGGNYRRPKPGGFIEKVNIIPSGKSKEIITVMTTYYVECIEPPERNESLLGATKGVFAADSNNQNDPDYMLKCSEVMRSKYEQLYGGRWIIVRKEPEEDSGLRGNQARDKAFADILNGEDCKTKRWLNSYLENKYKMADLLKSVPQADPRSVSDRVNENMRKLKDG